MRSYFKLSQRSVPYLKISPAREKIGVALILRRSTYTVRFRGRDQLYIVAIAIAIAVSLIIDYLLSSVFC